MKSASVLLLVLVSVAPLAAQSPPPANPPAAKPMSHRASGTFNVKLVPFTPADAALGRMSIDKEFQGNLIGTSKGEMLTTGSPTKGGSAAYVAIEHVTGTLSGRKGTFALQHTGVMTRGAGELTITVVPDSGTEDLTGLSGRLTIKIEGGTHYYELDYSLPEKP